LLNYLSNPMNLVNPTPKPHETEVTLLLEPQNSGRFIASVMEFPGCRVEADTRAAAIVLVQSQLQDYLKQVELIRVALPSEFEAGKLDPWDKLFGYSKTIPILLRLPLKSGPHRKLMMTPKLTLPFMNRDQR
jgi:predicted RNase H-like HicB family nuclease